MSFVFAFSPNVLRFITLPALSFAFSMPSLLSFACSSFPVFVLRFRYVLFNVLHFFPTCFRYSLFLYPLFSPWFSFFLFYTYSFPLSLLPLFYPFHLFYLLFSIFCLLNFFFLSFAFFPYFSLLSLFSSLFSIPSSLCFVFNHSLLCPSLSYSFLLCHSLSLLPLLRALCLLFSPFCPLLPLTTFLFLWYCRSSG